jgi:hypothetical protein
MTAGTVQEKKLKSMFGRGEKAKIGEGDKKV